MSCLCRRRSTVGPNRACPNLSIIVIVMGKSLRESIVCPPLPCSVLHMPRRLCWRGLSSLLLHEMNADSPAEENDLNSSKLAKHPSLSSLSWHVECCGKTVPARDRRLSDLISSSGSQMLHEFPKCRFLRFGVCHLQVQECDENWTLNGRTRWHH